MKKVNNIDKIRSKVDAVDTAILKLLSKRGGLAKKIGQIKKGSGKKIYVPSREKQIFDHLADLNRGPYTDAAVTSIFREIISATRALEQPIRVAFLGPESTFTHMAAVKHFGHGAILCSQTDISSVFRDVETCRADFGVVPIENSTEGVVNYTLDKFIDSELKICSEVVMSVGLHLLSAQTDAKKIERVYSHPHALAQCREWLGSHIPRAAWYQTESTSAAAEKAVQDKNAAAIASGLAADNYGLNILAKNIQDQINNFTRFLVLGEEQAERTGHDKTSIAFVTKDKPGVLFELLAPLAKAKINLTKIESRPLKTKVWEYMFFVDLDGHATEKRIQRAFEVLKEECVLFKILGSYPRCV
ncbi:MAG: prephenate dehydratase [Deltaproteobacteria bacterium]|nr:prephenate dehydratase [Deltaproteobacteria bacterium]